jgi:hypothetical protein
MPHHKIGDSIASGAICTCSSHPLPEQYSEQIAAFYRLRSMCSALRLTIPDELEERHMRFTKSEPDEAFHCSIPFLAYRRGDLSDFTKALHRFVLDGNEVRKEVTTQYRNDLREKWVLEIDEISRYKKTRNYLSRLAELHFAQWLETQNWQILNLELYGGQFDAEGMDNNQVATAFEIKFLGQREVLFELIRVSFTNPTAGSLGVYSPVDYLIFRIYEAARQLHDANTHRVAVVVVSDYGVSFRIPLSEGWIDWNNPGFLKHDPEIKEFLDREYAKNPNLDADVKTFITGLNEIWILSYKSEFELQLEHRIQLDSLS